MLRSAHLSRDTDSRSTSRCQRQSRNFVGMQRLDSSFRPAMVNALYMLLFRDAGGVSGRLIFMVADIVLADLAEERSLRDLHGVGRPREATALAA